ncbi:cell wall metabolism sensor histidine kinase WalK [Bacillus sp. AFS041924]|uniref:sensor histidine kinase n=1 Tax=Bacillus sp. AFS041924 TaxID=2033503 RepID=UPI000BFD200F|nr:HAMP domain-containing sensor histidine kinase [Bacillus sp. AFS041924]PGS53497.1 two-component sensor histidine kinase [Bacillus sp. AFS041924]
MKKSIVRKLFLSITLLLVIFLLIVFVGQSIFMQSFYTNKKVNIVTDELTQFAKGYKAGKFNKNQFQKELQKLYSKYNTTLAVLDRRGVLKAENNFDLTVLTNEGKKVYVPLNNLLYSDQIDSILRLNIKENSRITIRGYIQDDYFIPLYIKTNMGVWQEENQPSNPVQLSTKNSIQEMVNIEIKGKVINLHLPIANQYTYSAQLNSLMGAITDWTKSNEDFSEYTEADFPLIYRYFDRANGLENKVFIYPISTNDGSKEVIFAITSLQPVNEAMFVLKDFYIYAFIIALLLIVIVSFYYSKMISKPLLKMNAVTNQLAKLNFNEKIDIQSDDEIGQLSNSINSLSENLASTIENLQQVNSKLLKDIEKEKQLEQIRKEFISGVSHELKTPLSIVQSYAEGLKDGLNIEKNGYYADVILEEVDRMNGLVVDMLELSKLQSGTYTLRSEPFLIVECIDHVMIRMFENSSNNNRCKLNFNLDEDTLVIGEKRKIEQVIINILSNAIHYGNPGSVVKISLLDKGDHVNIAIFNEGNPIPDDKIDKIWNRFYRIDESRNRQNGGTGLGLSIVKTILDLHHSTIKVHNKEDGVEFIFNLKKYLK